MLAVHQDFREMLLADENNSGTQTDGMAVNSSSSTETKIKRHKN